MSTAALSNTQTVELARIERALDVLLSAAIRADADPHLYSERPGPIGLGVLVAELLDKMESWTEAQRQAADICARPLWELTRQGVTTLGKRLNEMGGNRLMLDVCNRVAALDPLQEGRRVDLIDKRWDGIGDWFA